MDRLQVRAYNLRFGDALLVSVPERTADGETVVRHVLIDVGNVLVGAGGVDDLFAPVIENVLEVLDGAPLDLYVMTHEHMDRIQGLLWAYEKKGLEIETRHAWLTASAAPDYYDRFEGARKWRVEAATVYSAVETFLAASDEPLAAVGSALMLNNNPRKTADCVAFLRKLVDPPTYVFRGAELEGAHPFVETKVEIWAPEEDSSIYYGRFRPMALGLASDAATAGDGGVVSTPTPPPGVDAGAFYNLVAQRRRGMFDNLLAIDKAANNSSVVFILEWRGWRLLFPGDAEHRSWKEMDKRGLLAPVHFLKVGHHRSWSGTPPPELLDKVLPAAPPDDRPRKALVSIHEGTYPGVSEPTLDELRSRCEEVVSIGAASDPLFIDVEFEDLN